MKENRVPLAKPAAPARTSSMIYFITLRTTTHHGSVTFTPASAARSGSLTILCIWSFVSFTFMASCCLKFRCKGIIKKKTLQTICCLQGHDCCAAGGYNVIYIKYIYHDTNLCASTLQVLARTFGTVCAAPCRSAPMQDSGRLWTCYAERGVLNP